MLPHRCSCVRPIALVYFTPLTAVLMVARVYRSRFQLVKVVIEWRLEDARRGLSGKPDAAFLLLGLSMDVTVGPNGRAEHSGPSCGGLCGRECTRVMCHSKTLYASVNYHRHVCPCCMCITTL